MEVLLKNVNPEDFVLLKKLSQRLGIEVEAKSDVETEIEPPDNFSVLDDIREAMEEIRHSRATNTKMQTARDFLNEL